MKKTNNIQKIKEHLGKLDDKLKKETKIQKDLLVGTLVYLRQETIICLLKIKIKSTEEWLEQLEQNHRKST